MWDSLNYISWFSDFASLLEDCLIYKHNTVRVISQYDLMLDLKMIVGLCDLYFMVQ